MTHLCGAHHADLLQLRRLALAAAAFLEKNRDAAKRVQQALTLWLENTDLASVRDPAAIAKLPEAERDAWKQLWTDVESLRKRSAEK
jgi:hypothetical protein